MLSLLVQLGANVKFKIAKKSVKAFTFAQAIFALLCSLILQPERPSLAQESKEGQVMKTFYSSGQASIELSQYHATIGTGAVLLASMYNGAMALVTTGTLTQYAPRLDAFSYSAGPQDRLIIKYLNGQTIAYQIINILGNLNSGAENFFLGDHDLHMRAIQEGALDVEIFSRQFNHQRSGRIVGQSLYENVSYHLDLSVVGTTSFDNDSTGSEYSTNDTVQGQITAPELAITLHETRTYHSITARKITSSSATRNQNSMMSWQGQTYQFINALTKKAFRDGRPNEADFWKSTGTLLKNGQPWGQLQLEYEPQRAVFALNLDSGEKIRLESWTLWGNASIL